MKTQDFGGRGLLRGQTNVRLFGDSITGGDWGFFCHF
jgi:hypothetical protein